MVGPAKAMGMGITMFVILIMSVVGMGMAPKISGIAGGAAPFLSSNGSGNATESAQGLKSLAAKNNEMKDTMRQEIDKEASAMLQKCAESGECEDLELLKEMCSNNILKLESCSDPRLWQLG
ncbi:MAG: hypothetical protein QXJ74_09870 [Nitrososphaera sp.]